MPENRRDPSRRAFGGFQAEGVDLGGGVARYENETVYLQILNSYAATAPALLDKLRDPASGGFRDYIVAVHGLKGASFGICADEIGHLAEHLERLAKAGEFEAVLAENDSLLRAAETLLANLNRLLASVRNSQASSSSRKERVASPDGALLQKMLEASRLAMTSDMEDILAELERYDYESGGEIVDWIREQTDNLEYEAIVERLEGQRMG
jgi:hypothetical protein